jgi:hypothetical protein
MTQHHGLRRVGEKRVAPFSWQCVGFWVGEKSIALFSWKCVGFLDGTTVQA